MNTFNHHSGQTFNINGARLYVEEQGDPLGMPLLFLPGGFGHIAEFNGVLPCISRGFRIIGIDSRGHGRSTMGDCRLTYAQLEADVLAVIEQLQLDAVNIVGYSDGGIVALRLAARADSRVSRVVGIGTHWQLPEDDPVRRDFEQITPTRWAEDFPDTVADYLKLNPEPDYERFARAVLEMWLDSDATGYPCENVRSIRCKVMMVRGEDDPYLSKQAMGAMTQLVPQAVLHNVPHAGHAVHDDQRELFLRAFEAFFVDGD